MSAVSKVFSFIMYANNTTLSSILKTFKPTRSNQSTEMMLNNELNKISEWLVVNKLSLNVSKTKFSIFHKKGKHINQPKIKIQGTLIERVKDFNFLGLILNENLNWKSHCNKISNNISMSIGILNRLKHFLPENVRIMLYNFMIGSHINYCILAW